MTETVLRPRRAPGDGLQDQLRRVLVGPQEPDDVATDLADVEAVDAAAQAGGQIGSETDPGRAAQLDAHLVAVDHDRMADDVLLAEGAAPVGDPEAPVVPLAGELVAVEAALGE